MDHIKKQIVNLLYRAAAEIKNISRREAPFITRNLRNDIQVFDSEIQNLKVRIGNSKTAFYAPYVHEGTGIYGYKKRRIFPKSKKVLAWQSKGKTFVRRSIAGQKPNPYMTRALQKYRSEGGLEKALATSGKNIESAILDRLRRQLEKTPNITFK